MRHVVYDVSSIATWICWAGVAAVWVIGALERRGDRDSNDEKTRDLASFAGAAAAVVAFALPASLWDSLTVTSPWVEIAGMLLLVPATAAAIWSRAALGSMWSSAARTRHRHALRTDGPYAATRHPIYSAIIVMLIGTTLTQGFGRWLLVLVAIVLVLKSKIAAEESLLTQQFPEQYTRYQQDVPQLIPRVPPLIGRSHRR